LLLRPLDCGRRALRFPVLTDFGRRAMYYCFAAGALGCFGDGGASGVGGAVEAADGVGFAVSPLIGNAVEAVGVGNSTVAGTGIGSTTGAAVDGLGSGAEAVAGPSTGPAAGEPEGVGVSDGPSATWKGGRGAGDVDPRCCSATRAIGEVATPVAVLPGCEVGVSRDGCAG
jgi:hypothetical protein